MIMNRTANAMRRGLLFRAKDCAFGTVVGRAKTAGLALALRRFEQTTPSPNDPNKKQSNETFQAIKEFFFQLKTDFLGYYYKNPKTVKFGLAALIAALLLTYFWDHLYPELGYFELLRLIESGEVSSIALQRSTDKHGFESYVAFSNLSGKVYRTELLDFPRFKAVYASSTRLVNVSMASKMNSGERMKMLSELVSITFSLVVTLKYMRVKGTDRLLPSQMEGMDSFMRSRATKVSMENNITKRFKDVAGMDEAKLEITEFVDFLKQPGKYSALGAKIPKGALLYGPPGTGKTLLGKACAGEAGVPFFYASGSEFQEVFVGVGSSRVRDLFDMARKNAPCIIFIDEIDALAKKRSDKVNGSSEGDSTLNQLLVEMDGFEPNKGIIVFGATNRKELLDPAILRPGRLDRMVEITLPDLHARKDVFKVHLQKLTFDTKGTTKEAIIDAQAKRLASLTPGFSGADIENICNEAAIQAVRKQDTAVREDHFESAVERIIGGVERRKFGDKKLKKTVAVHESGHGVVSWFLKGANPLLKLTIIPRSKGSLGFAQYLPNENALQTKEELTDQIVAILAGRCAEKVFFGKITTGAYDDFQKAYNIAYNMVTRLGMSDKLGLISLEINQFGAKPYSDHTNHLIDEECRRIVDEATQRCLQMVETHREKIEEMSNLLLEKETITLKDIVKVLGERPFPVRENFKAILSHSN